MVLGSNAEGLRGIAAGQVPPHHVQYKLVGVNFSGFTPGQESIRAPIVRVVTRAEMSGYRFARVKTPLSSSG